MYQCRYCVRMCVPTYSLTCLVSALKDTPNLCFSSEVLTTSTVDIVYMSYVVCIIICLKYTSQNKTLHMYVLSYLHICICMYYCCVQGILANLPPLHPPNLSSCHNSQYQYNVQVQMNIQLILKTR